MFVFYAQFKCFHRIILTNLSLQKYDISYFHNNLYCLAYASRLYPRPKGRGFTLHLVNTQQNEVMSYVWSLRQQIEALGGELTELPFDQDMIVRGFLGHFLNGKRMMLNFSDQGIDMSFVEHNSLTIREEEIANIIAHESRIQKNLLPNIIDAAVKRLSK